jgi:hypothetical protein
MRQALKLRAYRCIDVRIRMTPKIDPPRTDRIEITVTVAS